MWGRKKREDPKPELGTITETVVPAGTPALVIQPLDAEWSQDLAEKRSWIAASVSGRGAPLDLGDPGIALAVIDALLRDGIGAEERWKLEALGALLGDAMATDLGVGWCLVTDQWGTTPGLHLGGDDVAYPLSMIAKRVEDGEQIDVHRLFATATAHMRQLMGNRGT